MPSRNVLVTGSSGRIGRAAVAELLAAGHQVRGFDRVATPGLSDMLIGDITDRAAVDRAMAGRDTLIHLAATPDDDDFMTRLLGPNFIGVYHVMESAASFGLRRLILASSGQVVWHERDRNPGLIAVDTQLTPRYWYACGKVFLEAAGRAFAEKFGLSVLAVRLGWCPRTNEQVEEIRRLDWAQDVYLSPGDAGRFFRHAVESSEPTGFAVVYAQSKPVHRERYDTGPTVRLLGFQPSEAWPQGAEVVPRGHSNLGPT